MPCSGQVSTAHGLPPPRLLSVSTSLAFTSRTTRRRRASRQLITHWQHSCHRSPCLEIRDDDCPSSRSRPPRSASCATTRGVRRAIYFAGMAEVGFLEISRPAPIVSHTSTKTLQIARVASAEGGAVRSRVVSSRHVSYQGVAGCCRSSSKNRPWTRLGSL
jgi:hypothetical protein